MSTEQLALPAVAADEIIPPESQSQAAKRLADEVRVRQRLADIRREDRERAQQAHARRQVDYRTEREPGVCRECKTEFMAGVCFIGTERAFKGCLCPACETRLEVETQKGSKPSEDGREAAWAAICYAEYRTRPEGGATVFQRLEREFRGRDASGKPFTLADLTAWEGAKGLLLIGTTGKGKTRAAWRLMRRRWEAGQTVGALTSGEFASQFAKAAGTDFNLHEWLGKLSKLDMFLLDDLGKIPWTENVWGQFFELLEARGRDLRATVITTNETEATLGKKCKDPVTWAPLQRRLGEMETVIF